MGNLFSVGYFIISSIFGLMTFVLWARLFIRYFAIGTFHPFSQTIFKLTAATVGPIQKTITRNRFIQGRYDVDCILLLLFCEILKFLLANVLFLTMSLSIIDILVYAAVDTITQGLNLMFYAVIIRTVMSWIYPFRQDALSSALFLVTEPLFKWVRGRLPKTGIMDFSPFVVMIALKAMTILVSTILPLPIL